MSYYYNPTMKEYVTTEIMRCELCNAPLNSSFIILSYYGQTNHGIWNICCDCHTHLKKSLPKQWVTSIKLCSVVSQIKPHYIPVFDTKPVLTNRKDMTVFSASDNKECQAETVEDRTKLAGRIDSSWVGCSVGVIQVESDNGLLGLVDVDQYLLDVKNSILVGKNTSVSCGKKKNSNKLKK